MKDVILIGGATASGKSHLAMELARHFNTVIISADSRQVYRGLDIGTAKPSHSDQNEVPHYLLNCCELDDHYTAGRFETEAIHLIENLRIQHKPILVVGGTGLYLKTLWQGLDKFPTVPSTITDNLQKQFMEEGLGALQDRLQQVDPAYFREVDVHNSRRVIRALAVYEASGTPYSQWRQGQTANRTFSMLPLLLDSPREWLYPRIDQRVAQMLDQGLVEEARNFFPQRHLRSLHTVGYQELFAHFEGKCTEEEAIDLIRQHSRNYAKRQMTWFRKEPWWVSLPVLPPESLFERALQVINQ